MRNFKIGFTNQNFVYKESGVLPQEFTPYVFVYKDYNGDYDYQIGFYEPEYDNGKGGVFDGCGGHLDWGSVAAWKSLFDLEIAVNKEQA